jgi:hypothetical protein
MPYTVPVGFDTLLSDLALTPKQREVADGRVNHLRTYFSNNSIMCASLPFAIGSYERSTAIRWYRDIDVMVALDYPTYKARYDNDSAGILRWLRERLNVEYGGTTVTRRQVAIRMALGEGLQVDMVPTFPRRGGGYLMPNGSGGWLATNPPYHATLIKDSNVRLDSRLKPLVRLMKAWNEANGRHLHSFHLELMVEEMWQTKSAIPEYSVAVAETLRMGETWIKHRSSDPWLDPGFRYIDDYLTSGERALVGRNFAEDAKRAADALAYAARGQNASAYDRWRVVFADRFPSYG